MIPIARFKGAGHGACVTEIVSNLPPTGGLDHQRPLLGTGTLDRPFDGRCCQRGSESRARANRYGTTKIQK